MNSKNTTVTGQNLSRQPKHISFRLANVSDAEFILNLRLNAQKNRYLSPVNNSLDSQKAWLKSYKKRERAGNEFYYIIQDRDNDNLGVVRIYDFKNDSFCWGSWILCDHAPSYAAIESALLIYEIAFYELGFSNSHFDVRKDNNRVLNFHKKFGASPIRDDGLNCYLTISKKTYEKTRQRYRKFLREQS
jgi:RimJ/RimL family protein N-acetyltransferase